MPEQTRNRLLRRVDWRFLAGVPTSRRTLVAADPVLRSAVALVSREAAEVGEAENAQLAVAVNPKRAVLDSIARGLEANGRCWLEWSARPWRTRGWVERRLREAGLEQVEAWRPHPSSAHATRWLPASAPVVWRHFMRGSPNAESMRTASGLSRLARRVGWRLLVRAGMASSNCVVARRGVLLTDGLAPSDLSERIRGRWVDWQLPDEPRRLDWVVETGGYRSINKVVAVGFCDDGSSPAVAVKFARVPEAVPGLRREADVLQRLPERIDMRPGIPRHLFTIDYEGGVAVGETALPGDVLSNRLNPGTFRRLAMSAADWLTQLEHRGGRQSTEPWERIVPNLLAEFRASATVDQALLDEVATALSVPRALPIVVEHRDFGPWNVLGSTSVSGVIDWESAEVSGLPALDLVYFLTYGAAFGVDRAKEDGALLSSYSKLLDERSSTGAVARDVLAAYSRRLRLEPDALRWLRLILWMIHFRSERSRFQADQPMCQQRAIKPSLFARLWELEARHCLS